MNTQKKSAVINNGWILCPSKTFPGKFYYFNVGSGEAVWTLNNNEKTTPKKENSSNIPNINNRFHSYPEPNTPPDDSPNIFPTNIWSSTPTSNSLSRHIKPYFQNGKFTQFQQAPTLNPWSQCKQTSFQNEMFAQQAPIFAQQPTMFGQPANFGTSLGQYMPSLPNVGMPNFVWTPMQLSMTGWPVLPSDRKPAVDRVTQTSQIEREIFVHTSGVPLSKKFINYEKPTLYFNNENKVINKPKHFVSSTPIKNSNSEMEFVQNQVPKSKLIPEQVLNMETELPMNNIARKSTLHTCDKVETSNNDLRSGNSENTTLNPCSKIKFPKLNWSMDESDIGDKKYFHKPDLRLLLNAKRRKLQEEKVNDPVEKKKPKLDEKQPPIRKRVSFEMDKNNDTPVDEQSNCNRNIPTTKCNTKIYAIPTSPPAQTNLNDYKILENTQTDRSTDNNRDSTNLTRNMPTHRKQANNFPNDMPKHKITLKQHNIQTMNERTPCTMNNTFMNKSNTMNMNQQNIPTLKNAQNCPLSSTLKAASKSIPQYNMPNKNITDAMPPKEGANEAPKVPTSYTVRDVWYLIADADVMLEDLMLIDRLLQSDEKCRLIIPHCVRTQLEALCMGDCRGQQRVFVARQLSRRMSAPQKQYIVEPPPLDEDTNFNTTDAILDSCIRVLKNQHCVILITNDHHLKSKAGTLNIRCYNTEEIKNGAILQPKLFSELKKIKVIVDNENKNYTTNQNQDPADIPVDVYKKQLFVKDKQIERDCDIFINITKPKIDQKLNKSDQFEINNRVQQLNLEDTANRHDFQNQPPFLTQKIDEANKRNTNSQENTSVPNTYNFEKVSAYNQDSNTFNPKKFNPNTKSNTICSENIIKSPEHFQTNNPQSTKSTFDSTTKDNNFLLHISDGIEKNPIVKDYKDNTYTRGEIDKVTTAARQRIEKIISALNPKPPNNSIPNLKSFDKFKIPKLLPFKKGMRITSALHNSSGTTDSCRTNFKNSDQSIEGSLKKFCIKNKMMQEKLTTKMDEWTCTYIQIMEHLLSDTLQNNSAYLSQINISNTDLHESLTCIKMLYDDTKLKAILGVLVELLDKCTCSKGKIKLDTTPEDFMKMIGCGVLLVRALKTVLPDFEVLADYESLLNSLISNIESKTIDLDPELLRPTAVCRSEIENPNKETRRNFSKKPSMIIEYLKKHYNAWSSYDDDTQDGESSQTNKSANGGYKVVRLSGKNINMLQIDNNKSLSYIKTTKENNSISEKKTETKLVKLLDSNKQNQDLNNAGRYQGEDAKLLLRKAASKKRSMFSIDSQSEISKNDKEKTIIDVKRTVDNCLTTNTEPKIIRLKENINQYSKNKDEKKQHVVLKRNENTGPSIIRNIKIIDEYETRTKNKEPLDLDKLDYSEINDSTAEAMSGISNENDEYDFDNSDECNFTNDNFGCDNYKYGSNSSFFLTSLENNHFNTITNGNKIIHNKDIGMTEDNDINKYIINERHQDKSAIFKDSLKMCTENNAKEDNKMEAVHVLKNNKENYYNYTRNPPRDDSTNDSGFETETSQAHTLVKIFFNELSNTYKVLYEFILDFVKEIREEVLCEERKNLLHLKSSKRLQAVRAVIKQLKCIIERERSEDAPLKTTLLRYGGQSTKDSKITRYREIIKKCLEQAEILQGALKIIACVTIGDFDAMSTNAESIHSSIKCLKI